MAKLCAFFDSAIIAIEKFSTRYLENHLTRILIFDIWLEINV